MESSPEPKEPSSLKVILPVIFQDDKDDASKGGNNGWQGTSVEEDFPGVKALASMGVVLILGKMGILTTNVFLIISSWAHFAKELSDSSQSLADGFWLDFIFSLSL